MNLNFVLQNTTTTTADKSSDMIPSSESFSFNIKNNLINFSLSDSVKNRLENYYVTLAESDGNCCLVFTNTPDSNPEVSWKNFTTKFASKNIVKILFNVFGTSKENYNKIYMVDETIVDNMIVFHLITKEKFANKSISPITTEENDNPVENKQNTTLPIF